MKNITFNQLNWAVFIILAMIVGGWIFCRPEQASAEAMRVEQPTHFDLEYSVDGVRYVRTMNIRNARLLEGVAKDLGINASHLIAMCIQEGSVPNGDKYYACDPTAVGDGGLAIGAFQIHRGYHDIAKEDAEHIYYSAVWTAERLIQKGYFRNKERAIRCHNSCNPKNEYGNRIYRSLKH